MVSFFLMSKSLTAFEATIDRPSGDLVDVELDMSRDESGSSPHALWLLWLRAPGVMTR